MASPFRAFRKYQKTLIVVAGVILMFVFVIGDSLVGYLGGSRGGRRDESRDARAVAVEWIDGSLTNAEVENMVVRRRILNQFIKSVVITGAQAAYQAGVEPRQLRVEPIMGPDTPQQGVEQSVVRTRLFADAAREAGMRVSDETIVEYLDELGRGNVSRGDMRAMLNQSGRVPIDFVIEALREEMLAHNYIASHQFAFETVTPEQRYQDWRKVNDRVRIEAAAVPAENFLVDVKDPTDAELAKFFEDHKQREAQPDFIGQMEFPSATPGFRIPRKIDVQYIQGNYDKFLAKVEGEITEEEIAKFYEENKDPHFIKLDTGLIDDANEEGEESGENPPANGTDTTEPPAAATESESESTTTTPDAGAPQDEPVAPAEDAAEPAPPATTDESAPAGGSNTEPKAGDESPDTNNQSSGAPRDVFRLAAFQLDSDSAQTKAEDTAPSTDDSTDATTEASAPATESTNDAEPAEGEAQEPAVTEPRASSAAAAAESEKPKEFQPLEEVRDLIRRDLAERRAAEQLGELMNRLTGDLTAEFNTYFSETLDAQDKDAKPPAPSASLADLAPLAKENGLTHGRTGLVSLLELRDLPVGKSGSGETGMQLWQTFFANNDFELYQPIETVDVDGNRYISIKMSDTPGRIPELADVKDEVIRAWKLQQAAELAKKHAENLAKKAQEAKSPLADFLANEESIEVVRTDPFSQQTGGDVAFVQGQVQQQPLRLSQPDGIVAAGPEFLERVFELKDGHVGAVLNNDHSIAYIIRVVEHEDSPEELRQAFLGEAGTWPGQRLMAAQRAQQAARALVADVVIGQGLNWERKADEIEQDDEDGG